MYVVAVAAVLGVPVLLVGALVGVVSRRGRPPAAPLRGSREATRVGLTRAVGGVLGLGAAWSVARSGSFGLGVMLAPAVFGLVLLLAAAAGEALVRPARPAGVRSASLRARRVRDYLPRVTTRLVAASGVVGVATLVLSTATASADPTLGGMRQVACTGVRYSGATGPYPGSYYSLPLAGVLALVLVVAAVTSRVVVRRPRGAGDHTPDDVLRRRSLEVVVAATGVAVATPMTGVALVAGLAMHRLGNGQPIPCAPSWMAGVGTVLLVAALVHAAIALTCLMHLLVPSTVHRVAAAPTLTPVS